jgi:hypothetical protein
LNIFDELTGGQGELALVLEYDAVQEAVSIVSVEKLLDYFANSDSSVQARILSIFFYYIVIWMEIQLGN